MDRQECDVEFSTKGESPEKTRSQCVVVGVFDGTVLSEAAKVIDRVSKGNLSTVLKKGDLAPRVGSTLLLHSVPGITAERVLLVGLGKEAEFGPREYREAIRASIRALSDGGTREATTYLAQLRVKNRDRAWTLMHAATVATDASYRFDRMKSKKDARKGLAKLMIAPPAKSTGADAEAVACGAALGAGMSLA
ncbi:MAG TPA: M17 family peptidase N-terminal domain-containing protein, partial [Candidatus Krumholzibacteria bacterium]|nr:M17 family peptidase N-terminal domain-containing protein [Candidatus Krumholzibacteria bacterium]